MMSDRAVFQKLVERAMSIEGRVNMRPVIEKELLHYDILFALDQENILDQLTFQGGTALRLCYGGLRFSEDLDFTGGNDFANKKLIDMKNCLEKYLGQRYGLEIFVKEPKAFSDENIDGIHVDKWQLSITTSPEKKDIPKQKIKLTILDKKLLEGVNFKGREHPAYEIRYTVNLNMPQFIAIGNKCSHGFGWQRQEEEQSVL